jgi:3-oxoacyl-[acyl-carrier protein] reductase
MRLEGKVTIITGGAQGIGLAFAERFLAEGATVAIADIDPAVEQTAKELSEKFASSPGAVSGHLVDISDVESTKNLAADVVALHGRIDVLLNNAGIYRGIIHADTTPEYFERVLQVNILGTWKMSHAVVPTMLGQGSGKIINIGSDAAYFYNAALWPTVDDLPSVSYGVSKWGIHGLTKFMAGTLGPRGINVNCIAPGITLTDATREGMPAEMIDASREQAIPLRRTAEPSDIAGTAVFFASADADLVTGQVLCVDGGMCMPA